jgi:hypothetical protein
MAAPSIAMASPSTSTTAEALRMKQNYDRTANWSRWGPYLAERQLSTRRRVV